MSYILTQIDGHRLHLEAGVLPGKNHSACMEDALPPFLATWFLVVYRKTICCTLILNIDLKNSGKTTLEK